MNGLRLMEADGKTVFFSLERLDLRLSAASLTQRAPVVRALGLTAPYVHLARTGANQYSTDDLVAVLSAGPPAPPDAPPARFSVNNIRIDGGRFVFDDLPRHARHEVTDFSLGLPFVSSFAADEEVYVEPNSAPASTARHCMLAAARCPLRRRVPRPYRWTSMRST